MGKLFRRAVAEQVRLYWDHGRIGRAVELTVPVLFFRRCFADVLARSSIAFCNSVFADRIVMAASRLLGAAVEWLHQGCHSDLSADFLHFGAGDFPLKIQ